MRAAEDRRRALGLPPPADHAVEDGVVVPLTGGRAPGEAAPASRKEREEEGDEIGERKREIERRERGCNSDKWAPLPRGVHVSETGHQNSRMAKCERF